MGNHFLKLNQLQEAHTNEYRTTFQSVELDLSKFYRYYYFEKFKEGSFKAKFN